MIPAPLPPDEAARLAALRRYHVLDTPAEECFDDLTKLAAYICGTPIALVTLVDAERQWFKARVGVDVCETPRNISFCAHAILGREPLIVPDAQQDERFAANPMVTGPMNLRFYAGAPMVTQEGHALGTLCVADKKPRELSGDQREALQGLARQATAQLELRRSVAELKQALAEGERAERLLRKSAGFQAPVEPVREIATRRRHAAGLALAIFVLGGALSLWGAYATEPPGSAGVSAAFSVFLAVGFFLSLLASAGVWALAATRSRALALADHSTRALRVGEARLRAVMDNVADAIVTFGEGGAIESFNAAAERLFGYRLSEVLGESIEGLIPQSGSGFIGGLHCEAVGRRKDGSEFPIDLAVTEKQQGERSFLIALIQDITARKASQEALRASEARSRALIDSMLGGLVVVDARSIIVGMNPAAEAMYGYSSREVVGQHLKVLMPARPGTDPDEFLKWARKQAIGKVTEWECRRSNGEVFPVELALFEFETAEGRRVAGHVRDISERRKLEKMKKEFVATVSHELRTPLTSVRGSLSLLAGGALGDLPDEARDVVAIAERNTLRLITLINDILDLERLETGRLEMKLEPTALATVFQRSLESVRPMAEEKGVRVDIAPTSARVVGDADRLVQVLVNLLSNAVKFSPAGGMVDVSARLAAGSVEISVKDQGRGIPASHLDLIFERFQQVEASDARQKGGTGLGLAICKAIVEQHSGTIGVESEPEKGSRFWFRIPTPAEDAAAADPLLDAISGSIDIEAMADVLLVDDDQALLGVLARQLLKEGIMVRTAGTAAEAIAQVRRRAPSLLVLDLGLPGGEGSEVVEAMREDRTLSTTPLLVFTGRDLGSEERARLTLGQTRFLTKSKASDEDFRGLVLELLGHRVDNRNTV